MYDYLFKALYCFCFFQLGPCAEICSQGVFGRTQTFNVPEGSSLTLSCVVQHCEGNWTGIWTYKTLNETADTVEEGGKHHFTRVTLSQSEIQLNLTIRSVNQSDAGSYKCSVVWDDGSRDEGHWMHLNVTKVVTQRSASHRVLIIAGVLFCLLVLLGLARCLSSKVKPQTHHSIEAIYDAGPPPQPLPRLPVSNPTHRASSNAQPVELVYADISQDALRQQTAMREPAQSTVYSPIRFSSSTHKKSEGSI